VQKIHVVRVSMQTGKNRLSRQRLVGWVVLALCVHGLALSGLQWGWPAPQTLQLPVPAVWVQWRNFEPALLDTAQSDLLTPSRSVVPSLASGRGTQRAAQVEAVQQTSSVAPMVGDASDSNAAGSLAESLPSPPEVADESAQNEPATAEATAARLTPLPPAGGVQASAAEVPEDVIPAYKTQMPSAALLRYEMQRGALYGTGDLAWRPREGQYELKFEGRVAGLMVITQISLGGFDSAGLAPTRFTDQRIRRSLTAANFQRQAGKITYSQPQIEHTLRPGSQDRLSWMVQLAAIAAAEPAVSAPGGKVLMFVTGTQGDAEMWVFRCVGAETVRTGLGEVATIKFKREPREAYDTSVEVWLDPQRHHLPVRALQRSGEGGDKGFDLRLKSVDDDVPRAAG
jgi:hypothetical protein